MPGIKEIVRLPGLRMTIQIVIWAECLVGSILMAMRIYTNAKILRRWRTDFWLALVTYIFAFSATAFLDVAVHWGLGDHQIDLIVLDRKFVWMSQFYRWVFASFAILAVSFGKNSIIAFIMQIEGKSAKQSHKAILLTLAIVNFLLSFMLIPLIWTQCEPVAKLWTPTLPGTCPRFKANGIYAYFLGSFEAFLDLFLALYPITIFWKLQVELRVRLGLIALFGFGLIACVCAIMKTESLKFLTPTSDHTYQLGTLSIWSSTEMWTVFIVSCLPAIRPLFLKLVTGIKHFSRLPITPINSNYRGTQTTITAGEKSDLDFSAHSVSPSVIHADYNVSITREKVCRKSTINENKAFWNDHYSGGGVGVELDDISDHSKHSHGHDSV